MRILILHLFLLLAGCPLATSWTTGILDTWKSLQPNNNGKRRKLTSTPRTVSVLLAVPENEDSAMSAYDRAMSSFGQQGNQIPQSDSFPETSFNNPEGGPPNDAFVQSNFNDPMYAAEERETLEQTASWGNSVAAGNSMVEPSPPQLDVPYSGADSPSMPSTQGFNANSGQKASSWDDGSQTNYIPPPPPPPPYQQSFIDALSPNSDKRRSGLVMPDAPTDPVDAQLNQPDEWAPMLDFVVKDDAVQRSQPQQQSNKLQSDLYINATEASGQTQQQQQLNQPQASAPNVQAAEAQQRQQRQYVSQPPGTTSSPTPPQNTQATTESFKRPSQGIEGVGSGPTFGMETIEPPESLDDFISTVWEDQQEKLNDPLKTVSELTKDVLGIKPERKGMASPSVVQPGATKRILESMDSSNTRNPNSPSQWRAFQNAERRWADLKKSKKFRYDFKLLRQIQEGAGPPLIFISDDCAMGNAKCCSKLRDVCDKAGDVEECMDLDYEGPPLDDFGQPIMDYDVAVLGGTLGIFYAMALQLKGMKVCVIAPRELKGQEQEWNVGRDDMLELERLGILTRADLEASLSTVFDGTRAGFKNKEVTPLGGGLNDNEGIGFECYLNGVLNLGVSPKILIERTAARFKAIGGEIREQCPLGGVAVSPQVGCAIDLGSYNPDEDVEPITAKLVLDCMGYGSPVARQQRYGQRPDSICMVFGSSAGGYNPDRNRFADAMYSFNGLQDFGVNGKHQYFWETFPVGTNLTAPQTSDKSWFDKVAFGNMKEVTMQGPQVTTDVKTTYMFTYMDTHKNRPSLESMMDDYFKLLPVYQKSINNPETDLKINRVLYDYFPAYRDSPMKPQYSRVLSVGEAAGLQSPISFGGFRSVSRHIGRVSGAVAEAVQTGCLHKDDLGEINAYMPNLSAAWLFRDVMSVKMGKGKDTDPKFTNRVLAVYMKAMYDAGPGTVSPLMHDVLRFDALARTLVSGIFSDPLLMRDLVKHVGVSKLVDFLGHVWNMGVYSLMDTAVSPIMRLMMEKMEDDPKMNPRMKFQMQRRMENWKFGSGNDYDNDRQF